MDSFKHMCTYYNLITGSTPAKLDDLVTDPGNVKNWRQLIDEIPMDPWGNEYIYKIENNLITITSEGLTNSEKDDITISFRSQSKNQ
ncbi:MAG: type II secretion system protein GspG [Lentisphaeraceae bacterium]|nr:type II secretion system protein GspG [Lentisphaeraceae bacterium]